MIGLKYANNLDLIFRYVKLKNRDNYGRKI